LRGEAKMKLTITILGLVLVTLFAACSKGQLTKEKAQQALSQWKSVAQGVPPNRPTSGSAAVGQSQQPDIVVEGVQELPQENSAKASLRFNNFEYGSGRFTYSGSGVATFSHYNDGRWVLTKVETSENVWEGKYVKNGGLEITVE
jgi:hypothetical protein